MKACEKDMPKAQLVELFAHGLGVIDDARVEFGPGFNVITGETGAGKTLLLGALELCLGGDGSVARHALSSSTRAAAVFVRPDGGEVVLAREAGGSGRLRSTVDGATSSAEALRLLADELIVIHGQHDSLALRQRAAVLKLLDASGGISTEELDTVRRDRRVAHELRERLGGDALERRRDREQAAHELAELVAARLQSPDELSRALEELTRLTELREGQRALATALDTLDGDGDSAILSRLASSIERLPPGSIYDSPRQLLRGALDQAREAVHDLFSLSDAEGLDPERSRVLEERVSHLQLIARKYGGSLEAALATLSTLAATRRTFIENEERLVSLDAEITQLDEREVQLARTVRRQREVAATRLNRSLLGQLPRVALDGATLRFDVSGDAGADVQILFSANPGRPEGPLQALASGGELSRVLLALSLETAHPDVVAVFDEVDAGIGGQVAQQIGECLQEVARGQQVLAVTHLASVAAKADHHFVCEKFVHGSATATTVRPISGDERVEEIARMLAGDDVTAQSRALAAQLLESARSVGPSRGPVR